MRDKRKFLLIFILLIASFLRFYKLGQLSLWFDEALTLLCDNALLRPVYALTHVNTLLSQHKPAALYIHRIIFYYWLKLVGFDEFRLRSISAIFGVMSVVGLYLVSKMLFNKTVGLWAGFILSLSPFHIYYSQEFRLYSLISFLTVLTVYFFVKAIYSNKMRSWALYILFLTLNIYMHYIAFLLILINCIFLMVMRKKFEKSILNFVVSHIIVLFLLIPFFEVTMYFGTLCIHSWDMFYTQMSAYLGRVGIENLCFTLKNFSCGYSVDFKTPLGVLSTFFFLILFIYGVIKIKENEKRLLLVSYSLIPIVIIFLVSLYRVFYVDRHFIPFLSFYYLGIAYGICSLKKNLRWLSAIALVVFLGIGTKGIYLNTITKEFAQRIAVVRKKDYRKLSESVFKNYKVKDVIMHTCEDTAVPLKVYLKYLTSKDRSGLCREALCQEAQKARLLYSNEVNGKDMLLYFEWDDNIYDYPEIFMHIDLEKKNYNRIWLIYSVWDPDNFTDCDVNSLRILKIIHRGYTVKCINNFDGMLLFLCEKKYI